MKRLLVFAVCCACLSAQSGLPLLGAGGPSGNGYATGALFTFNVYPASNLTAFPNLILGTYSQLADVAHGGYVQNTVTLNGQTVPADLIFTSDSAGTRLLSWEIEAWNNTTGAIVAWVKDDRSSSADTLIYVWVGKASVTTYQCTATSVWDTDYKSVWHVPNGTTLSALDSTSNVNNGSMSATPPTAVAGKLDGAVNFVAANSEVITFSNLACLASGTAFTLEAWVKQSALGGNTPQVAQGSTNNDKIQFVNAGGTIYIIIDNASSGSYGTYLNNDSLWHHMVAVYDGTQSTNATRLLFYFDGVQQTLAFNGTIPTSVSASGGSFMAGEAPVGSYTDGVIDELRVSNTQRSANWIAHEYRQQDQASAWYTVGSWTL